MLLSTAVKTADFCSPTHHIITPPLLLLLLTLVLQFMVRFRQPDQAQELLQAFAAAAEAGDPKQVAGCAAELRMVEGEEEEQYYKRVSGCCKQAGRLC
jgi:hypothetical protein